MPVPSRLRLLRRASGLVGVLTAAATICLGLAGCQAGAPSAATVNGHVINEAAVNDELKAIVANPGYTAAIEQGQPVVGKGKGTYDLAFTDRVLSRQILLEIIREEVVRRHLVVTPDDLTAAAQSQQQQMGQDQQGHDLWLAFAPAYREELALRAAEVTALQNALVVTDDAAVQAYYDANKAKLAETCASHILVATQAQADDLHRQLVAGADFATLAEKNSTDTQSAAKGGDLGCAPAGTYVPEFEAAMNQLAVGQLSGVVHTQFGYHIIKVTGRKTSLADLRTAVVQQLQSQASRQLSQFVQAAVGRAKISVDPRYGTFDKANGQVSPPNAPPAGVGQPTTTVPVPAPAP